ncbi:hypothetical protein I7I53_09423 [Histoplasma capsulatum var. duboisii H88]|uniref:Uncharacterized protein n=1 Tax=Ajellomyces capsulatus (strain H88) TaxID=544711 RepID=A0A8A1L8Z3_AJEC8|nr:hypothetical protein I7I53_09423 [Histoplasma capsulatum var. duboisii H88]
MPIKGSLSPSLVLLGTARPVPPGILAFMYMYRTYMYRHQCTVRRWGSLITPTSAKLHPAGKGMLWCAA